MSTTIRFISITYCIITLALAQSQPDLAAVSTGLAPTAVKKYVGKQLSCHPVHQQLNATKHAMERMHSGFEIQAQHYQKSKTRLSVSSKGLMFSHNSNQIRFWLTLS